MHFQDGKEIIKFCWVALYGTAVVAHCSIYGTVRIFGGPMVIKWHCRNRKIKWWLTANYVALQKVKIYNMVAISTSTPLSAK